MGLRLSQDTLRPGKFCQQKVTLRWRAKTICGLILHECRENSALSSGQISMLKEMLVECVRSFAAALGRCCYSVSFLHTNSEENKEFWLNNICKETDLTAPWAFIVFNEHFVRSLVSSSHQHQCP